MSQDDIEKIMKVMSERGASVRVDDPRVTKATNWLLAAIAAGLLAGFLSMFSSINQLKEQNATLIAEIRFQAQVNQAQDSRLNIYDDRLRAVERVVR
jgi:c-di-GMP-related signal transduction protein